MLILTAAFTPKKTRRRIDSSHNFASKPAVAELRNEEIIEMDAASLIEAIRAAQLPFLQSKFEHRLEFCDREMLERLVFLARKCCRNQGY